ncbi:SA1320 family protein [Psychrobacillus sp. NPDC093200]|uniref:SA1320 family protein n=1 Tax=Psychrobacillus sp. NPDC093200 TaxID=3390656 RepID=UPI003CFE4627
MTTINPVSNVQTNDQDLVELAGSHAYRNYPEGRIITVNDKVFRVVDTQYGMSSGLDALTVQNNETKELTVVFVGSADNKDWIDTNAKLLADTPPAQLEDAQKYFDWVNTSLGNVDSVTGNSLGGGLTNSVAINNPQVKAVTLNPAILPAGLVDPTMMYENITNYYSRFDFLTSTEEAIGMGNRIPGKKYNINNGVPLLSQIVSNHTGYVTPDKDGNFVVEVGIKGQPGHGYIHIGADDHIVTSIWTGNPIYGGYTEKIEINQENMILLSNGIRDQVKGRITNVKEYIGNSVSIVEDENAKFSQRVTTLQEIFQQMLEEIAGDPVFKGIAETGAFIKAAIDDLIDLLNTAEDRCRILNSILNSKPAEIIEFITSTDISVETLFAPARDYLNQLKLDVDNLVTRAHNIMYKDIPELFRGGTDNFVDAVVGELDAHYNILKINKEEVYNQLTEYETQVNDIANSFINRDVSLADAIHMRSSPGDRVDAVQKTEIKTIQESSYLVVGMKIKEVQVQLAHNTIVTLGTTILSPILSILEVIALLIEAALTAIILAVKAAQNIGLYGNPIGLLMSLFTDYEQRVKSAVASALEPLIEMEVLMESLRIGFNRMNANLPEMLDNFKPYLDTAIFEPAKFENVRLYNVAALAILEEMELLFNEIIYQLADEKANAIEETLEVSKNVLGNLQILKEQVDRGTL